MPWQESCVMDKRVSLIADHRTELFTMVELCERYGISRKTGYKWLGRYAAEGAAGLMDRSRAPHEPGRATPDEVVAALLTLKQERPSWGPRKLVARLARLQPERAWPSHSTASAILKRAGLTQAAPRRRRAPPTLGPLTVPDRPNRVWAADHKGWVRLGDGRRCEPLTITDGMSRFLIGLEATTGTTAQEARPVFERAFATYGLPDTLRTDNGPPFASPGLTGLTELSAWWIRLGIRVERITPGRPQQNGRHERFHRTLLEAMTPPCADAPTQQARFDEFCARYNEERPHEALGQMPPAHLYRASLRRLPEGVPEPDYPAEAAVRRVRSNGEIKWAGKLLHLSQALIGERVAIAEDELGRWVVSYYDVPLGLIDRTACKLQRFEAAAPEALAPDRAPS
jgi:transposase InsO family protein